MLVVLGRVEDHPLLPRLLAKLLVRLPRPEERARRQDVCAARAALVRQPVGDALDHARRPDLVRLAVQLVGPAYLQVTADELAVEGRPWRLPHLDRARDACRLAPLPRRLRLLEQAGDVELGSRLEREHVRISCAERLGEACLQL
eukprot:2298030-Prymnesium_polylepis.1